MLLLPFPRHHQCNNTIRYLLQYCGACELDNTDVPSRAITYITPLNRKLLYVCPISSLLHKIRICPLYSNRVLNIVANVSQKRLRDLSARPSHPRPAPILATIHPNPDGHAVLFHSTVQYDRDHSRCYYLWTLRMHFPNNNCYLLLDGTCIIRMLIYHLSVVVSPESLFALRTDPSGSESFEIAEVGPVELVWSL